MRILRAGACQQLSLDPAQNSVSRGHCCWLGTPTTASEHPCTKVPKQSLSWETIPEIRTSHQNQGLGPCESTERTSLGRDHPPTQRGRVWAAGLFSIRRSSGLRGDVILTELQFQTSRCCQRDVCVVTQKKQSHRLLQGPESWLWPFPSLTPLLIKMTLK